MKNKINFWARWYMIVAYCFVGFFIIISGFGNITSQDTPANVFEPQYLQEDYVLEYLETMETYTLFLVGMMMIDLQTALWSADGTITFDGAADMFEESSQIYKDLEFDLYLLIPPKGYEQIHEHYISAVKAMKEGTKLYESGYRNVNVDTVYLGVEKIEEASRQFEIATILLEDKY